MKLILYVAGQAPHSVEAQRNLSEVLKKFFKQKCELEIVDVFRDPARALRDGVVVTPCLLKLEPPPVRTVLGALSNHGLLLDALSGGDIAP